MGLLILECAAIYHLVLHMPTTLAVWAICPLAVTLGIPISLSVLLPTIAITLNFIVTLSFLGNFSKETLNPLQELHE